MILLEVLCQPSVSSKDRISMSTVEAIERLDIIYSTRFHFTSDLASTCGNLVRKKKKTFYYDNIKRDLPLWQ